MKTLFSDLAHPMNPASFEDEKNLEEEGAED